MPSASSAKASPKGPSARPGKPQPQAPEARSRVTNFADILPGIRDGRSVAARRYRDILYQIIADQGGVDRMTEVRLQLARRFAASSVLAELMEAKFVGGEDIDVQEFALVVSTSVRVAQRLGVVRVPRDVTPNVRDYIEGRAA